MNTLYHFGDSYGTVGAEPSKHFVQLISETLNYNYKHESVGGSSNDQIFNKFLKFIYEFKSGDMIFFNFSFFVRGSYYDKEEKKIMSTNYIVNDIDKKITSEGIVGKEYLYGILNYQLDCVEDYNRKVFDRFDTIFKLLSEMNISIYYIFIENSEWSDELLNYGTNIKFENGFYNWLHRMGYHNHEECHYTKGIQGNIRDYIIEKCFHLSNPAT